MCTLTIFNGHSHILGGKVVLPSHRVNGVFNCTVGTVSLGGCYLSHGASKPQGIQGLRQLAGLRRYVADHQGLGVVGQ